MSNKKRLIVVLVLSFLLFSPLISLGQMNFRVLELSYPNVGNYRPTTTKTPLPLYIKYIFNFALLISALIIFGSLVYGGFRYVTSAGNSSALNDAKQQIFASILGLAILLASYIILTTVNPELIKLSAIREPATKGIILFKNLVCCINNLDDSTVACPTGSSEGSPCPDGSGRACATCAGWGNEVCDPSHKDQPFPEWVYDKLAADNLALRLKTSVPTLEGFLNATERINAIFFYETSEDLRVTFFNEENWAAGSALEFEVDNPNICGFGSAMRNFLVKSVALSPRLTGAYLCDKTYTMVTAAGGMQINCGPLESPGKEILYVRNERQFSQDFSDKVKGLYLRGRPRESIGGVVVDPGIRLGAILHRDANFQGGAELFLESQPDLNTRPVGGYYRTGDIKQDEASSITLFPLADEAGGDVIFYEGENQTGRSYHCTPAAGGGGQCCAYTEDGISTGECNNASRCRNAAGTFIDYSMCQPNLPNETEQGLPPNDKINSMYIGGNYLVILYQTADYRATLDVMGNQPDEFLVEVFTDSDKNFIDNPIGRCRCRAGAVGNWGCGSCLSSFIILPVKR